MDEARLEAEIRASLARAPQRKVQIPGDPSAIGRILGHSNVQTTQRYAHLRLDAQRVALDKLSKLVESSPGMGGTTNEIAPEFTPDVKKPASQ